MKKEITQKALLFTAFILPTLLFVIWILPTFFLPNKVAMHFDLNGEANRIASQSEMILIGVVMYLVPIIFATIFANVKAFVTKVVGLASSIAISIAYIGVSIYLVTLIFSASGRAILNGGVWTAFAFAIVGVLLIIISHALVNIQGNLVFAKQNKILTKNNNFNKINLAFNSQLALLGLTICIGCSLIKSYYVFILLFVATAIFGATAYFAVKIIGKGKSNTILANNKDNI